MRIIFIGPPGAGKGTQCKRLSTYLSIQHLSTGEMLRRSRDKSALGRVIASYIDGGRLAPDYLVVRLVIKRLDELPANQGCLFDGFPRTLNQAQLLDEYLDSNGREVDLVINLVVPQQELVRRLLRRAELENRADDTVETISARLQVFQTQTSPLLEYYRGRGIVQRIDGEKPPDEVFSQIKTVVDRIRGDFPRCQ